MSTQFRHYAKELLNIALPIIMGNLGFILIGAGDVLIAGHHSTDTLAAISIATAITNCIQTFGIGLISFTICSQRAWHFHANLLGICRSLGVRWSKY